MPPPPVSLGPGLPCGHDRAYTGTPKGAATMAPGFGDMQSLLTGTERAVLAALLYGLGERSAFSLWR